MSEADRSPASICHLAIGAGGVPKHRIAEAYVGLLGLAGDVHTNMKHHGGADRAVCLFSLELIEKLKAEGHPIFPGSTGENVTISGLAWAELLAGTRLALGDQVVVELTRPADPCKTIRGSFLEHEFKRLNVAGEMRWYTRVIHEGTLRIGQLVRVL
jgi:MOSC domain-containing protein YiiM